MDLWMWVVGIVLAVGVALIAQAIRVRKHRERTEDYSEDLFAQD